MSSVPRTPQKRARRRITVIIVAAVVVAILACVGYYVHDRIYFGTDPRTLSTMYVQVDSGFGTCKDFPLYRFDLDAAVLWDGTCTMNPGGITIDPTGKSGADEEGFTQWRALSPAQVDAVRTAVQQTHVDVWKSHYGSNNGCSDAGGWTIRFVYTNGDSEATTVEDCHGSTPPRASTLWSAINAIT